MHIMYRAEKRCILNNHSKSLYGSNEIFLAQMGLLPKNSIIFQRLCNLRQILLNVTKQSGTFFWNIATSGIIAELQQLCFACLVYPPFLLKIWIEENNTRKYRDRIDELTTSTKVSSFVLT